MTENGSTHLPLGKLEPEFLSYLIAKYTTADSSIIVAPQVGIDATVIAFGDKYLIAKTDPITFTADDIGFYAININANDIACMGGIPRWFLATLLLPEKQTDKGLVEKIFSQIQLACRDLNISFCGGHTEVTYGMNRPILVGQMLGEVSREKLIDRKNVAPGDVVLLTKGIAIEAVSIIARERREELNKIYAPDFVEKCANFIYHPGISVLADCQLAVASSGVHALHDPTEGGLAMGLHELSRATHCGIKIIEQEIPIIPEANLLCDQFNLNILGVIASGALLIVAAEEAVNSISTNLKKKGINVSTIGTMMPEEYGIKLVGKQQLMDLPKFHQDEITKLF